MKSKAVAAITDLTRYDNEDFLAWKIRCCLAKRRGETDMDWVEIRDMLGLDIHPDQLRKMAVGYDEYDQYINMGERVVTRVLALSDFHVPFNLPAETFKRYRNKVDILVLNGDIQDCQSISSFTKRYRIPFAEEMIATREFLIELIELISPKKVFITKGNHEHRMVKYLSDRLNEDLLNIMPDTPLDLIINDGFKNNNRYSRTSTWYDPLRDVFADKGIDVVYTGDWFVKVGKVIFAHPLSYSSGMLKTTEKAVNFFLRQDRDFEAIVLGHTHKLGSFIQGGIAMFEQGCCCDLEKLDYADGKLFLPNQNGFLFMGLDENGSPIKNQTQLIEL